MKTAVRAVAALAVTAALAGCAGSALDPSDIESTSGGGYTAVTVRVWDDGNVEGSRNVVCSPDGFDGSHPDPETACGVFSVVGLDVFDPVGSDEVCTMQYGGPEQGSIRGVVRGKRVDVEFDRTNGCEITRWAALDGVWYDPTA